MRKLIIGVYYSAQAEYKQKLQKYVTTRDKYYIIKSIVLLDTSLQNTQYDVLK